MSGARNVRGGLILLAAGLAAGLVMSCYAFQPLVPVPASLAHYDDLPRRLLRLAHIAAVMLPLINVVVGPWLDRVRLPQRARGTASWLLLLGAITLPCALAIEALVPTLIWLHLSALPAVAFCLGVFVVSGGACRTTFTAMEAHHATAERDGAAYRRDRRWPLQAADRDV
jgi:hypothetical protein